MFEADDLLLAQGKDVIGTAHTGSGKTAAFALPILQTLAEEPYGIFALVLTPTRQAQNIPGAMLYHGAKWCS